MATLFDLAQQYLNRALPKTFKYDRTPPIGTNPPGLFPQPPVKKPIEKLLPVQGGGAEGFSVYNPDPNRTRTSDQYSPYNYRQAAERNLIGSGDSQFDINKYGTGFRSETEANKFMDMYPDYYKGKQLTGIPGAIQGYMKNSIPGQLIGSAVRGIESLLPVNKRAIIENEALGAGIRLDDIGRVVSDGGNINTAENIMAGYNLAKITPETIQKRRDVINENMKDPEQKKAKLDALDEFEEKMFGETGIKTKADLVFDDKSLAKDPTYKSTAEKITEGITTAEDDSGSDMLEGIETILGTKPIIEYRDPIMDMVSPPTQVPFSLENIIEQNKAKQAMQDLINMSGTADDIDNDPFFKDATADSGKIKTDATTKTKTKPKTITDRGRGQSNVSTKPKGPPTGITRPGAPSKSKSIPDRGRGQSNVGTKSKGPVSTKGQAGPPSQRGGGGGGGGGGGCFLKGTLITMLDGTRKPVEQVDLGNEVAIGGKVFATGKFLVKNLHDYKGIKVSGSHMVSENNKWVRVEDSEHGKLLGNEEHTVYVFGSENRRILINDILFTDYFEVNEQDKLMNNEEDFFDNWKLYAKQDSGNNVDIINAS